MLEVKVVVALSLSIEFNDYNLSAKAVDYSGSKIDTPSLSLGLYFEEYVLLLLSSFGLIGV